MKSYVPLLAVSLLLAGCTTDVPAVPSEPFAPAPVSSAPAPVPTKAVPPAVPEESAQLSREALAAYGAGDSASALRLAEEALAASDVNYEALALKGLIMAFDGAPDEGAALIEQSLALYPDYVQGYYDLAMAQKLGGRYEASIASFRRVLDADPQNVWSLYGIATNYADLRDRERALSYLRQAAALDPAHVKPEAAAQDHFQWLHGDAEFDALVR